MNPAQPTGGGRTSGAHRSRKAQQRRAGPITIRDVAQAAGVSPMTVSNLLNNRSGTMRAETRQRIEEEIRRLGYRPHNTARGLRLAKQLSIGMIIIDDQPHYLADPFTTQIVAGLTNHLSTHGYGLVLQGLSAEAFRSSPLVRSIRTDAICLLLSGSDPVRRAIIEALLLLGQPIMVFQDTLRFPGADLCIIRQTDREGGRLVAQQVLKSGARRVAMLIPDVHWPAIAERVKGVREAVRESADQVMLRIVRCGDAELRNTQEALKHDIEEHGVPDAIIAGNDQMGIAAMKLIAGRGLRIPSDVAITGFNAFEFWQYTTPVLTTVRSLAYEMGRRGAGEILARLRYGFFDRSEIILPIELQPGGST
jgi:LacI family transcriptional regulator